MTNRQQLIDAIFDNINDPYIAQDSAADVLDAVLPLIADHIKALIPPTTVTVTPEMVGETVWLTATNQDFNRGVYAAELLVRGLADPGTENQ